MGKPYSQELRERVIAALDGGTGAYVAAPLFRVSVLIAAIAHALTRVSRRECENYLANLGYRHQL